VNTGSVDALLQALGNQVTVRRTSATELYIDNMNSKDVGKLAHQAGIELDELSTVHADLEEVFLQYTRGGAGIR